jgi:hypothetical protein
MERTTDVDVIKHSELSNSSNIMIPLNAAIDLVDKMPTMKDNNGIEFIEKSLIKLQLELLGGTQ